MNSLTPRHSQALKLIISAPSGGGKTSLIRSLLDKDSGINPVCSHTTRSRRMSERDGTDYWFVDRPAFQGMVDNGEMLEYNENYSELYGTSAREVTRVTDSGKDVMFEVDWNGACAIRKIITDVIWIFLIPPNLPSLQRRLRGRGRDSSSEIEERMTSALHEIRQGLSMADYIVNNDHFDSALEQIRSIITAERCRRASALWRHQRIIDGILSGEQATGGEAPETNTHSDSSNADHDDDSNH